MTFSPLFALQALLTLSPFLPHVSPLFDSQSAESWMARFARIDLQIRADRLIRVNHLKIPKPNPFLANPAFRGTTNCELQAWGDSRESRERYKNKGFSANRVARIIPIHTANRRAI